MSVAKSVWIILWITGGIYPQFPLFIVEKWLSTDFKQVIHKRGVDNQSIYSVRRERFFVLERIFPQTRIFLNFKFLGVFKIFFSFLHSE